MFLVYVVKYLTVNEENRVRAPKTPKVLYSLKGEKFISSGVERSPENTQLGTVAKLVNATD